MKNFKESEVVDYIVEQYSPVSMPEVFYKELPVLRNFQTDGLNLAAGEKRKFGCYVCPGHEELLNVFVPGYPRHFSVPADVFFKKPLEYNIYEALANKKKTQNASLFMVGELEYTLVPNFHGGRELIRSSILDLDSVIQMAKNQLQITEIAYCVPRIFGNKENGSLFWELREKGSKTSFFLKVFTDVHLWLPNIYPVIDTQITIGANSKTVFWRGVGCWMRKRKLHLKKF